MTLLVSLHFVVGLALVALGSRVDRRALLVGALAPAAVVVWLVTRIGDLGSGRVVEESTSWAPGLGLSVDLRLDGFAALMVCLVSGLGVVVLVYGYGYFPQRREGLGRLTGLMLCFSGSMLGLVLADNLLVLATFWELTAVTSFLLIGNDHTSQAARAAALQAILTTGLGGLAMLGGFIVIGNEAGTYRLSSILASPPTGTAVTVGLMLVLLGAVTKSAQYPFHSWLPGAMVAPTPVSAYLHSATIVKAGCTWWPAWRCRSPPLRLAPDGGHHRARHDAGRWAPGDASDRPQAPPCVRHREPAGVHVRALRRRHTRNRRSRVCPAGRPRPVQGRPVHGGGGARPPARHPRRVPAASVGPGLEDSAGGHGRVRRVDGGAPARPRFHRQGGRVRVVAPRRDLRRSGHARGRGAGLGAHPRVQRPVRLGCVPGAPTPGSSRGGGVDRPVGPVPRSRGRGHSADRRVRAGARPARRPRRSGRRLAPSGRGDDRCPPGDLARRRCHCC